MQLSPSARWCASSLSYPTGAVVHLPFTPRGSYNNIIGNIIIGKCQKDIYLLKKLITGSEGIIIIQN